ncbi:MAG: lipid A deacylase LpxR family protein [Hyphomonas sp.]
MNLAKYFHLAALVAAFLIPVHAVADEPNRKPAVTSITTENDFFGGGTDRNYSNGVRLERVSAADDVFPALDWVAHRLPWLDLDRTDLRQGFALSHVIFTPEDIRSPVADSLDRPYAAWLAVSGTVTASDEDTQDTLQINLGVVGPSAGGEFIQNNWHKAIGLDQALGWESQLRDEPGIEIIGQRLQTWPGPELPMGLETDFGAHVTGAIGNVRTYAGGGMTARIGWDLDSSFGPPRIRPALSGAGEFIPGTVADPLGGYIFIGGDIRAVARDMFLDGNLWRDGPRVNDRRTVVADLQLGAAVHYQNVQVAFTIVNRTEQFKRQNGPQRFGAISFSVAR